MRHFVHTRTGSLLLAFQGIELFAGGFVFGFNLFQLDGGGGVPLQQIGVALAVFLQLGQADLDFGDGGFEYRSIVLGGLQGGIHDGGTGHGILQGGFGLHHADAVFAVVEHQQGVALVYVLMFGEADFLDIARSPQVDGRDILFHLGVVAGLGVLVVQEEEGCLHHSPDEDGDAQQAGYTLATAHLAQFLGLFL